MKIILFLSCVFAFTLQASVFPQGTSMSVEVKGQTIRQIIQEIETRSEYRFFYNDQLANLDDRIDFTVENVSEFEAIEKLFEGKELTFKLMENNLILIMPTSFAKQIIVTGIVTDENGEPLPGVSILIKGTTRGTITNLEGNFSIEVDDRNSVLELSFVGCITQEITVGDQTMINLTMEPDVLGLEEVVVVGYGTQKKVNLTGAVSAVNSEVLADRPIVTLADGLKGVIPNLNIIQSTGSPGLSPTFNIRGTNSVTGGSPLILIDGVPKDVNMVNPNDIESVSVLKDAASAAIYGARAAYGVVLITTKSGRIKDRPTISIATNYAINSPTTWLETMDSKDHLTYMNIGSQYDRGIDYFDEYQAAAIIEHYNDPSTPPVFWNPLTSTNSYFIYDACDNTDWPREFMRESFPQYQFSASISGGSKNFNYYTSFSHMKQTGMAKRFDEKYIRNNITVNLDYDVLEWLSVGSKVSINNSAKDFPASENRRSRWTYEENLQFHYALWPEFPPYIIGPEGQRLFMDLDGVSNPVQQQLEGGYRTRDINDTWVTGIVKLTPIKNMSINLDYSTNIRGQEELNYISNQPFHDRDGNVVGNYFASDPNSVEKVAWNDRYNAFNAYADYENTFSDKHYVKILVGYNQEDYTGKYFWAKRENLIIDAIPYMDLANGTQNVGDGMNDSAIRGAFTRLNYIYDERYLIELNGRYDGSSKFPKDSRFSFFPSVSIGWRVDNEAFFSSLKNSINLLKFRASYGSLGNQDITGYYPYISQYGIGSPYYTFGGERPVTTYAPGLVSPSLTWETVKQMNFGVDFGAFNNRFSGSFDIYRRDTKDMLTFSEKMPSILAVNEPRTNAADLKTTGFDLTLGWKSYIGDLSYGATVILSDYTSEITKYSNPQGIINSYYEGHKIGEIWGFETGGIFQTNEEAAALDQSQISGRERIAGDLWFVDLDGDGKITYGSSTLDDPGDRKIIGNSTPRYSFGLRPNVSWKGFDLIILLEGVLKRDRIVDNWYFLSQYWTQWGMYAEIANDYWTPENRDAYFPRPVFYGNRNDIISVNQTRYMQNAAYLRLRQLTLSYTIPPRLTRKVFIERLKVYVAGQNLLTWTNMTEVIDPELSGAYIYPLYKSISVGLNIDF